MTRFRPTAAHSYTGTSSWPPTTSVWVSQACFHEEKKDQFSLISMHFSTHLLFISTYEAHMPYSA